MIRRVPALSRHAAALACVLALGTGVEALAQDSGSSADSQVATASDPASKFGLGAMLDVGAPDGIGVSIVVRPAQWLRVNGGVTTNTLSLGVRGGISLVPLSTFISPSLNLDVGHYFNANYNDLVDRLGGIPLKTTAPFDDVGYNYAGGSVGLEIGKPQSFSVYLRVGLAHGSMTIEDAEKLLQDVTDDPDITAKPLSLRFTTPSIKLGFLLYLF
ncbi:autotransporter outer membrane beta-barrel domain-containing protein [Hyalangium versicolor]|uniref:autotransporter outer membrane beta-barrel domain-containing protein n=1 Tax=Hyalangium versicolor TaxID=2861190 RepID=UPI001CCDF5D2|nr:autotransporter outer membrane beta-barrel domain-containing protein [Hyalangium versicolor]